MVAACSGYLGRPAVRATWVRYSLVLGAAVSALPYHPSLLAALLILLPPLRARKQVYDGESEFAGGYSGRYARVLLSASESPAPRRTVTADRPLSPRLLQLQCRAPASSRRAAPAQPSRWREVRYPDVCP